MRSWLLAALLLGSQASAQQPTPPPVSADDVDRWLESAEKLRRERKNEEASALFERALLAARELALERQQARALCGAAGILFDKADFAAARERALLALEISERLGPEAEIGRASHLVSIVAQRLGRGDEARMYAERAIAVYEAMGDRRARGRSTLALLKSWTVPPSEQKALHERAIEDARSAGDQESEAAALQSLGDHQFTAGEFENAFDTLHRAAALFEAIGSRSDLGTVYNSLGRVYRAHGRLSEALKFQLKALESHQAGEEPLFHIQSLNAVATVYLFMGQLPKAREYYERAFALSEKSSSPLVQDFIRANLAGLLLEQGEFARAASAFEKVIARGVDVYPSRRYALLSYAYLKMGKKREALEAAQHAVDECGGDENTCVHALRRRSAARAALGDGGAALADVNAALERIEETRSKLVPTDFFKQDFHSTLQGVYSEAIALQLSQKQDREALATAELARSRAFLDLLATRDVRPKGQPQAEASPELRSGVMATPAAAEDLVRAAARLQSTLVLYWTAEDELFIWVVTPDGNVQSRRVAVLRSKLFELTQATAPFVEATASGAARPAQPMIATRGAMSIALGEAPSGVWRELYGLLIGPVRGLLPRAAGSLVTIVPHGPLSNLSFAALQDERGRYLLEDYTLHYVPAGAVLQFTASKRRPEARSGALLVVADPLPPKLSTLDRPLARLPGARSEAAAISRLLPAARVTVLRDDAAGETAVREAVSRKAVLHFATHAIVRDDDPFGSFLALGRSVGGAAADGFLTAQEVYGLDLDADLVVLSACRSAGGRVTGDGIATFARAFLYAGTPSLVASLWDVADEPVNRLLPDFHRAWLGGQSKAVALRTAQLRLLRDLRVGKIQLATRLGPISLTEHPVFWAGFALFGEPD
jgi:CHAT domain-containing protein/tetratricopeptide (TPR) repeat protein